MMWSDPNLPDRLREIADGNSGTFPAWVGDHFRAEADRIDASRERWARLLERESKPELRGRTVTFTFMDEGEPAD